MQLADTHAYYYILTMQLEQYTMDARGTRIEACTRLEGGVVRWYHNVSVMLT